MTSALYLPFFMFKMMTLLACIVTIENMIAVVWIQFAISLLSFFVLIIVWAFKLWSVYIFDIILESVNLMIVIFLVPLVYKSRGDSYNIWLMVVVFFKSLFILIFSLVYIFFAWKNWWVAWKEGKGANPNKTEQYFYDEKDDWDEDFDKVMNQTENPFFADTMGKPIENKGKKLKD